MPVSLGSVTSEPDRSAVRLLVVSVSWLGDGIMAMPALSALRQRLPRAHISVLAKPSVLPLWSLFTGIDAVLPLKKGFWGMLDTISLVRNGRFDFAYVLPNSFRSALIPWLAGVPGRRGLSGQGRGWMLTESVSLSVAARSGHQSLEMMEILHVKPEDLASPPFLKVPEADCERARPRIPAGLSCVAFFPGAAYGPSKRWPAARFAAVGRKLLAERGHGVLILGGKADKPVCDEVAAGIGPGVINLAGDTDLIELAALLGRCKAALSNDSGGMHLAAGLGLPVVGIFGLTDPGKTGPVGKQSQVLCAEGVACRRDIHRDSEEARAAMESITVERVYEAISSKVI